MATHVIRLDPFDPLSVISAERETRRLAEEFDRKVDEFVREIAEIGRKAAAGAYGGSVTVSLEGIDNGFSICADGKAVVFMEFGAGAAVNTGNMFAGQMPFEVRRGSYSDSKDPPGPYARTGYQYWTFGGQRFTEVQPRNGMQHAHEAMMQDMLNVAMRIFG